MNNSMDDVNRFNIQDDSDRNIINYVPFAHNNIKREPEVLKQDSDHEMDIKPPSIREEYPQYDFLGIQESHLKIELNQRITGSSKILSVDRNSIKVQSADEAPIRTFIRLLIVKRLTLNFKKHLMEKSYVLSSDMNKNKRQLLQEDYIKEDLQQNKKQFKQSKAHQWFFDRYKTKINPQKMKFPVWNPGNKYVIFWEIIWLFLNILMCWWMPFRTTFQFKINQQFQITENFFLVFLLCDILLKLNKGFINQGQTVTQRSLIIQNYIKTELFQDIGSLLILILFFYEIGFLAEVQLFVYFILNLGKINQGLSKIKEIFTSKVNDSLELVKLILVIFFFAHVIACIWHYIGLKGVKLGLKSWITEQELLDSSVWTRYNYSLYWATMTMVTVGYGDITPKNNLELATANITMFVACGVFAFSVNSIGIILQNINESGKKLKKNLSLMNYYMNNNKVGLELQNRVRNYLEYCFEEDEEVNDEQIQSVMNTLSKQLKAELLYSVLSEVLKSNKLLSQIFSEETQRKIAFIMEQVRFSDDDKIIQQNKIDDQSLFIIQKGSVILQESQSKKQLGILQKGDSFGEQSFLTGQPRNCTVISHGFTRVYKIKRDAFIEIIKENPNEFQRFNEIKDKLIYQKQLDIINLKCICCQSTNHYINMCPSLRYIPDLERIIKKSLFHSDQPRISTYKRYKFNKKYRQSLVNLKTFQARTLNLTNQSGYIDDVASGINEFESLRKQQDRKRTLTESSQEFDANSKINNLSLKSVISNNNESKKQYQKSLQKISQSNNSLTSREENQNIQLIIPEVQDEFKKINHLPKKTQLDEINYDNTLSKQRRLIAQIQKQLYGQQNNSLSFNKTQFSQIISSIFNSNSCSVNLEIPNHQQDLQQAQFSITKGKGKNEQEESKKSSKSQRLQVNNGSFYSNMSQDKKPKTSLLVEATIPEIEDTLNQYEKSINLDIDQMSIMINYYTDWNVENVIKQIMRKKKLIPNQKENQKLSKYSFLFQVKFRVARLWRYLKRIDKTDKKFKQSNKHRKSRRVVN